MSFTVRDLLAVLLAFCAEPFFFLVPGLALASCTNLFHFKNRSLLARLAIGLALSVTAMPILVHLLCRTVGFETANIVLFVTGIGLSAWLLARGRIYTRVPAVLRRLFTESKAHRIILAAALLWTFLCPLMIQQFQIGNELFDSFVIYDWSRNTAVADAIRTSGVPPDTFYFSHDQTYKLFYYYFWLLYAVLAAPVTQSLAPNNSLPALIAADIWTGYGLIAVLCLTLKLLYADCTNKMLRNAVLLLPLGALHLGLIHLICWGAHVELGTYQWFIDQEILGFVEAVLWVPQHIAGLTAAVVASLILHQELKSGPSIKHLAIAAIGFASAAGTSAYVGIPFLMFWLFWTLFLLVKRLYRQLIITVSTGAAAALPLLPFAIEIQSFHRPRLLTFGAPVYHLNLKDNLLALLKIPDGLHSLVTLLLLVPLRFVLWLGPSALGSLCYFWRRAYCRTDLLALPLALSSFLSSTFIHSSIQEGYNDDMGWRSVLPLQLMLLIWTARYLDSRFFSANRISRALIILMIALAVLGSAAEMYALRHFTFARQKVALDPEHVYHSRLIYEQLNAVLKKTDRVQGNIANDFLNHPILNILHGHRQALAVDRSRSVVFGGDDTAYSDLEPVLQTVFETGSKEDVETLFRRFKLTALVVSDRDHVWSLSDSWLMKEKPDFENLHYKAYLMRSLFPQ